MPSNLEEKFLDQVHERGLPEPEREHIFAKPRRWRLDFYWPAFSLAVEIEGGVWTRGRHTRSSGFAGDVVKYNEAARRGITVIRVINTMIEDRSGIQLVEEIISGRTLPED